MKDVRNKVDTPVAISYSYPVKKQGLLIIQPFSEVLAS
jgi:hypothetical protein